MNDWAPPRCHSLGHQMMYQGTGIGMPPLNPSVFHGAPSSLDEYLDGVRYLGAKIKGGEVYEGIEVSYQNRLRIFYYWISTKDHLPRFLRNVHRGSVDHTTLERWEEVVLNGEIPESRFQWSPPAGWKRWERPDYREKVIAVGTAAPDFELPLLEGGRVRLSDLRGKVVWLYVWGIG